MQQNAIITLALNYTYSDLKVFLQSLNRTSFTGVVYIIVNNKIDIPVNQFNFNIEQIIVQNMRLDSNTYEVGLYEIVESKKRKKLTQPLLNKLLKSDFTDVDLLKSFSSLYHCQTSRYAIYLTILLKNKFDNVFLTDSRDVYFQSNPFESIINGLNIFQENVSYKIKDRPYNNQWVKLSTNFWNYFKVRRQGIFCSGTILGDYENIMLFLKSFLYNALENNIPFDIKGIDQGLFNVLIHTQKIKNYVAHSDQKLILTLSAMDQSEYRFDDKFIYNASGYASDVIHQYDRHENLISFIQKTLLIK